MSETKLYPFQVRMTRAEKLALDAKASLAGLSKSEYARRRLTRDRGASIKEEGLPSRAVFEVTERTARAILADPHSRLCTVCTDCKPGCTHFCHGGKQ